MQSELDVIDSLNALGYEGKCLQEDTLAEALKDGISSPLLRDLIVWLTNQLHVLRKTDEKVSSEINDINDFAMDLSMMLKELGCTYPQFVVGPSSVRFATKQHCILMLEYLISELMVTKMHWHLRPRQKDANVVAKSETHTARTLEQLVVDLKIGQPPANISPKAFFDKLNFKVEEQLRKIKPGVLSEPMLSLTKPLTDAQWQKLQSIMTDLDNEYNLRRQMLITRLEVTVQSFNWSERLQSKEHQKINEEFQQQQQEIEALCHGGEETNIAALLAARNDLAIIEKTSSSNVRKNTACQIQKHVIGSVPDRGGRANEHAPPPPEMPAWQQQRATGPVGGRGGGRGGYGNRGGGGGGGRGRGGGGGGGWQAQPQRQQYQQQEQNFDQRGNNQNWMSGSGRVQGSGWTQGNNRNGGNEYQRGGGGGGGNYRGQNSNYHRGGGRR